MSRPDRLRHIVIAWLALTSAASAAEIPKQYRGSWCSTGWETIWKRCDDAEMLVNRDSWGGEDHGCTLVSVSKSKYGGHILRGLCEHADGGKPPEALGERRHRRLAALAA
jgi:hypothetical protein